MKKSILYLLFFCLSSFTIQNSELQKEEAFDVGEWFKFRIHYGIVTAGYAELEVKEAVRNNKKVFHAKGRGYTTGMTKFFFKVEDDYQSYFDKESGDPYQFVRKIDEGGYTKYQEGFFNHSKNAILVKDYKNKTEKSFVIPDKTQDILSTFYYLRNHPDINKLKAGESIDIDMFFDEETTKFKLKFVGKEDIKTDFGIVPTMIFRPFVQAGRVFKEQESLTVWISDDENKLPLRIKAELAVGSLKADLEKFRGLKNPFMVKVKK